MKAETKRILFGERYMTGLKFGSGEYDIPSYLMQRDRQDCILVTDKGIEPFPWKGLSKDTEGQYILFEECRLESITEIASTYRSKALEFIKKIAMGIKESPKEFPDLIGGIFPLYRVFIHNGENILLLPPECGNMLAVSMARNDKDKTVTDLTKVDTEMGYTLILEMVELMYYAASGAMPYGEEAIRRSGYHALPLSVLCPELEEETEAFVTEAMNLKGRKQRDISGNRKAQDNLGWFLKATLSMKWNLQDRTEEETEKALAANKADESIGDKMKKAEKTASFRAFWRHKGTLIAAILVVAGIISYLLGNFFYQKFRPPVTRDMEPAEIITHMVTAQNALDTQGMDEGFKKSAAQFNEVVTLYVNKTTRSAYENINAFVNAEEWLRDGMPKLSRECSVYGFILSSIEKIGDTTYRAQGLWYSPYASEDEEAVEQKDGYSTVYIYEAEEEFEFQWNRRGWWECIQSGFTEFKLKEVLYIENY